MIELSLWSEFSNSSHAPFVAKLSIDEGDDCAVLVAQDKCNELFSYSSLQFSLPKPNGASNLNDVVFADPGSGRVQRWIRSQSAHNTLLVTERCDQLCVMCSQPPKKTHVDNFVHFKKACILAEPDAVIGLSGGEPLLCKDQLFELIEHTYSVRPDVRFHVLTNGQHFEERDLRRLRSPAFGNVLWGVPLYAASSDLHDAIVVKKGAFERLLPSLAIMARSGLHIELRTVLLQSNYDELVTLARFIANRLPFIDVWALMQLERIGFAKNRWQKQFVDHSSQLETLENAITIACAAGTDVALYNVPTCTVSRALRPFLRRSISDWKQAFPKECAPCSQINNCSGFFSWHTSTSDYNQWGCV
jgi:His-Xaa-Ser system radical SAM maturase HxsC